MTYERSLQKKYAVNKIKNNRALGEDNIVIQVITLGRLTLKQTHNSLRQKQGIDCTAPQKSDIIDLIEV